MQSDEFWSKPICFKEMTIQALQQGGEAYLVSLFKDVNVLLSRENRVTATKEDLQLAKNLHDQEVNVLNSDE